MPTDAELKLETPVQLAGKRIWIAGHRGMVGSALLRRLARIDCELVTAPREEVDLRRQVEVEAWLGQVRPDVVVLAAAKVGGILANSTRPAEFIYDNLAIELNIIHAAHQFGVKKLLFLGSSCIYPKFSDQPITEEALLTGALEPTNQWYAVAKIAGLKLCQAYRAQYGDDFISAMPTNLYGPGDNFDLTSSHVVPGLMARMAGAKARGDAEVVVWGTGTPRREFLYVDDLADALVHMLTHYSGDIALNVGVGLDTSIFDLAHSIKAVVGYEGQLVFDTSKPDGTPRKLLDVSRLHSLGWRAQTSLREGLARTWEAYRSAHVEA